MTTGEFLPPRLVGELGRRLAGLTEEALRVEIAGEYSTMVDGDNDMETRLNALHGYLAGQYLLYRAREKRATDVIERHSLFQLEIRFGLPFFSVDLRKGLLRFCIESALQLDKEGRRDDSFIWSELASGIESELNK